MEDNKKNSLREIGDIRPELMPTILTYVSEIASLIIRRMENTSLSPIQKQSLVEAFSNGFGVKYDSVRRSRQRVQELHPELKPPERITALRDRREDQIVSELYKGVRKNG